MEYGLDMDDRGAGGPETIAARRATRCKYCFIGARFVGPPGDGVIHESSFAGRLSAVLFRALVWLLGLMLGLPPLLLLLVPFA